MSNKLIVNKAFAILITDYSYILNLLTCQDYRDFTEFCKPKLPVLPGSLDYVLGIIAAVGRQCSAS
jgi:hypothetical protein